mgnify:CR=1 FL=1
MMMNRASNKIKNLVHFFFENQPSTLLIHIEGTFLPSKFGIYCRNKTVVYSIILLRRAYNITVYCIMFSFYYKNCVPCYCYVFIHASKFKQ